jgi:fibronectin type 3 domain-containing protein
VSGYIIFRRAEWEKEFEWLAAVKGSSYVDVAVRPGETYYYVVRSYDSRTNQESKDSPVMKVQVPKEGR